MSTSFVTKDFGKSPPPEALIDLTYQPEVARRTLDKIESLRLPLLPIIYELWFQYFHGNQAVIQAIEQHKGSFDTVACYALHKRYLGEATQRQTMRKVSDHLQTALALLVDSLKAARHQTSGYTQNLEALQNHIHQVESVEDLGLLIETIVQDTHKMLEKNQTLEQQLLESSLQMAELRQKLESVSKEALTDALTGLCNRKAFDKQLEDNLEKALAQNEPLTLLLFDIDHFKSFNDNFGHQTGDQVLKLVAHTLTDSIKGQDLAARYGGEEFAIILPNTPMRAALTVANNLRQKIEQKDVINKTSGLSLGKITLSGGAAEYVKGEPAAAFIRRADAALYTAKRAGRNRVIMAP